MATKKKVKATVKHIDVVNLALGASALLCAIIAVVFASALVIGAQNRSTSQPPVNVNLGIMQYSFEGNKTIKRSDPAVANLKTYLVDQARKDIAQGCEVAHYSVVAFTHDDSQVLLNYGCGTPSARMFAVRDGQTWKTISPTNQFDSFGTPLCSHVVDHAISTQIAPVCSQGVSEASNRAQYQVR